jgi:hypothetical protein
MKRALLFTSAVVLLLQLSCGTGSEVEGRCGVIEGRAVDSDGIPVAAASVRIRPDGFCALYDTFSKFDTVTDAEGFFQIDTLPANSYTIEINKNGTIGKLQQLRIGEYDSFPKVLPKVTLLPTGTITGRINLPISDDTARPVVALYNVDYLVRTPITQEFTFKGIPAGVYSLRIIPSGNSRLIVELHDFQVIADSTIDVGTLNFTYLQFFNGCTSYTCDSIAVRSLLDINGLFNLTVESVSKTDSVSHRIITLDLSGLNIVHISKELGSLSALETLNLSRNAIGVLPEHIGYLRKLKNCYLDENHLHDLPYEVAYCCSLKVLSARNNLLYRINSRLVRLSLVELDLRGNLLEKLPEDKPFFPNLQRLYLDSNAITSLPDVIMTIYPLAFTARGNRLCGVTPQLALWLSRYDEFWFATQFCTETPTP